MSEFAFDFLVGVAVIIASFGFGALFGALIRAGGCDE